MTDKKLAKRNIAVGIFSRIIVLLAMLITQIILIRKLGKEANGIYTLYTSIIGILSVVNLGIGSAISFSMYKPIKEGNNEQVTALYYLYRKVFFIISVIILLIGLIISPFITYLAKDNTGQYNILIGFIFYLLSVVVNYSYAHKEAFIIAHKENYIIKGTYTIRTIFEVIFQIIVLLNFENFELFVLIRLIASFFEMSLVSIIFKRKYRNKLGDNRKVEESIKEKLILDTKSLVIHRFGLVLVSTFDNIIISFFVGINDLGVISNYLLIATSINSILIMFFSEITSIVGHDFVNTDKEILFKRFNVLYYINIIFSAIFMLGYVMTANGLVQLMFAKENAIENLSIIYVISASTMLTFMSSTFNLFKDASGTFYHDRFVPLLSGVVNIILSIILVKFIGIIGVIIATVITRLLITHVFDVIITFKFVFNKKYEKFFIKHYMNLFILMGLLFVGYKLIRTHDNTIISILINGGVSITLSMMFVGLLQLRKENRQMTEEIIKQIKK